MWLFGAVATIASVSALPWARRGIYNIGSRGNTDIQPAVIYDLFVCNAKNIGDVLSCVFPPFKAGNFRMGSFGFLRVEQS